MKNNSPRMREGAAIVELAICLPLLIFVILAGMDILNVVRAKQALVEVTHETSRVMSTNDIDENQCRQFATELLQSSGLSDATIEFDPPPSSGLRRGSRVSVMISVPVSGNVTTLSQLFRNLTLAAGSSVNREIGEFPVNIDSDD